MFQKILSDEDFELLQPGSFVIQYPISLEPKEEINLSDESAFALFEVQEISQNLRSVTLTSPDHPSFNNLDRESINSLYPEKKVVINKHAKEIIRESVWWYRQDDHEYPRTTPI